ncbi:MAG: 50S ribosomal protein L15 [Chloroflexi bacterium RBG_13_56_8]|nr:MAG: 50S ribosomal protein L15 [Chloroflexi bacterium RBG_13_56_8]
MKLHELREPQGTKKRRNRVGRGIAAGQGKTCGYGTKGSRSRAGRGGKPYFEGGQLPLVRRLANRRGFRNVNRVEYVVVNVESLNRFEPDSVVGPGALIAAGLVKQSDMPIKILGEGELQRSLTVQADKFSQSARNKIEAVGGIVQEL